MTNFVSFHGLWFNPDDLRCVFIQCTAKRRGQKEITVRIELNNGDRYQFPAQTEEFAHAEVEKLMAIIHAETNPPRVTQ